MSIVSKLTCFKAYDIRGRLGDELNEDIAYRVGRATAQSLKAKSVVLGFDARATSPSLAKAIANGICDAAADVFDIGLAGTEEVYAAVSNLKADAGIEVTASHNPIEYNGMKIVKQDSQPLTNQEFDRIKTLATEGNFIFSEPVGSKMDYIAKARGLYIEKLLSFVNLQSLRSLKIVINSGNGAAGPTVDALVNNLKDKGVIPDFRFVHHNPDASFPNGIPNPLLAENRGATADAVVREEADFGVAFDGDFDRCFLFDHNGEFIPGEYIVGLLAEIFLHQEKGASVVHDPRVIWNTIDVVERCQGHAVVSKTGHAFVKAKMRRSGAIYGGEMSAHHYFRDFAFCDSGIIPWLMVWQLLSEKQLSLSELISDRKKRFPSSGELNFKVLDADMCLKRVRYKFASDAISKDELDGLSMTFENWRFNIRKSNTEPFVRLNVESRGDLLLLEEKTQELRKLIESP